MFRLLFKSSFSLKPNWSEESPFDHAAPWSKLLEKTAHIGQTFCSSLAFTLASCHREIHSIFDPLLQAFILVSFPYCLYTGIHTIEKDPQDRESCHFYTKGLEILTWNHQNTYHVLLVMSVGLYQNQDLLL